MVLLMQHGMLFAGSGNNGDGNLTFNGVEYVNVWDGG